MIETERLTRTFGRRTAVKDVSLELQAGEIVALVGPNGAGKTTLIRLLAGMLDPTSGEVRIDGKTLGSRTAHTLRRVGLVSGSPGFYPLLTGWENLLFFAQLHGLGAAEARRRAGLLLDEFELTDAAPRRFGQYSQGMQQRLSLVRALLHEPEILLLDEPVSSVDPRMARRMRTVLAGRAAQGAVVLISTHLLAEAEALCNRALFMRTEILAQVDLAARRGTSRILLDGPADRQLACVRSVAGVRGAKADGRELVVTLESSEAQMPALVRALVEAGAGIVSARPDASGLQDEYDRVFGA